MSSRLNLTTTVRTRPSLMIGKTMEKPASTTISFKNADGNSNVAGYSNRRTQHDCHIAIHSREASLT